ncbi:MAG: hypothetical protein HRU03_01185 [Nanoarchaeales archaeon]|nr:hypothetical protein [Nanoarchaeales archaeon]
MKIACVTTKHHTNGYEIVITDDKGVGTIFSTNTETNIIRIGYQRAIQITNQKESNKVFSLYGFHEMLHIQSYNSQLEPDKKYREIFATLGEYYFILKQDGENAANSKLNFHKKSNPNSYRVRGMQTAKTFYEARGEDKLTQLIQNYITTKGIGKQRFIDAAKQIKN